MVKSYYNSPYRQNEVLCIFFIRIINQKMNTLFVQKHLKEVNIKFAS
jgi:hypothetical protein